MFTVHKQRQFLVLILLILLVLLASTIYADPRVGPVTPANSIIGGSANDQIGSGGVIELPSGNVVISSPSWNGNRGAVTCLTLEEYRAGSIAVSAANSLVGSTVGDKVGVIVVLENGNYVVLSSGWDNGASVDVGAVTWVNGTTCIPAGESTRNAVVGVNNSLIGANGVVALTNGNYVVVSSKWNANGIAMAGAITWGNGSTGITGEISTATSLVGTTANDQIGSGGVTALTNGNYVVKSPLWNNAGVSDVGAVTWGNGNGGTVGAVNATNSLVGSTIDDGKNDYLRVISLTNGNYVVQWGNWDSGLAPDVGAVTWGNGNGGTVGTVSAANSLVGSTKDDGKDYLRVIALTNGNYVVQWNRWDSGLTPDVGAVTWGNGNSGTVGTVSDVNSMIGSSANDRVALLTVLANGHYVVGSGRWDNGAVTDAGAVAWVNGNGGTVGQLSPANAIVGSQAEDWVGGVTALTNGHYVITSSYWDDGAVQNVGAVTWANGNGGTVGEISLTNSLIGSQADDRVGLNWHFGQHQGVWVKPLPDGDYVVPSIFWDNGTVVDAGAVTWGNGQGGTVGYVNATNSMVGSTTEDLIASGGITVLTNGNYVIQSPGWDNSAAINVGAVTWVKGDGSMVGEISATNSLIGSADYASVGYGTYDDSVIALANGHFIVRTLEARHWEDGSYIQPGSVTWGNGQTGIVGEISPVNSLIDSSSYEFPEDMYVIPLKGGDYIVYVNRWLNDAQESVGSITWGNGLGGTVGAISPSNSLVGASDFSSVGLYYDLNFSGELANGSFVAHSIYYDEGLIGDVGAITWLNPDRSTVGTLSSENSLVGSSPYDYVGSDITPLADSSFLVISPSWDNAGIANVGAITWSEGAKTDSDNTAPVLATIGDRTTYLGGTLSFDVDADDDNLPDQTLTFSIESGAPTGAVIDPVSGQFSWILDETVTVGEYPITVTVIDDGDPALTDSETFTITVEAANLVGNYGFENAGNNQKLAAGWKAIQLTKNDRRMCDTDTKSYAREGGCAYRFSITKNTTLKRTIQKSASKTGVAKNDALELRGWVKATNLTAGARLSLVVTYNNGTKKVAKATLTAGTYEYQLFTAQVTLTRPIKSLKVKVEGRGAKGTFFVDDMAVVEVTPESLAVSVPAVPDLRGVD